MLQIIRLLFFGLLLITGTTFGFEFSDLNTSDWKACATEGGICRFDGTRLVRYGKDNSWSYAVASERIECSNREFIDSVRGRVKVCEAGKLTSRRLEGPRIRIKLGWVVRESSLTFWHRRSVRRCLTNAPPKAPEDPITSAWKSSGINITCP